MATPRLSALAYGGPARHRLVIVRELLIALVILIAFVLVGPSLLAMFRVSPAALTAAGGIVLLLIAIRMIFPTPEYSLREPTRSGTPLNPIEPLKLEVPGAS